MMHIYFFTIFAPFLYVMEQKETYSIPFKALANGVHNFDYKVGSEFFADIEDSLIEDGDFVAHVQLTKSNQMLKLHFSIEGKVTVPCDVCLDPINYELEDCEGNMVVKFGETTEEIDDELFQLAEDENELSIAQWIYEIVAVNLPIHLEHPLDENGNRTCNAEMLKKLDEYLVTEEKTNPEEPIAEETDPRWAALKGLLDKQ